MGKKKKRKPKDFIDPWDIYRSVRRDWGKVKPYQRVEKDKKKYSRRKKHKKKEDWDE